jgi:sugar lactone lactonase YvrE
VKRSVILTGLILLLFGPSCQRSSRAPAEGAPEPFFSGLPALEAVAFNPQGVPFVALADSSGRIVRIVGAGRTHWLTETGGQPAGLAFDSSGDLYVADRRRGALYRVTPWGLTTLAADWLGAPQGVAAGPDGSIYFADGERAAVYRLSPDGQRTQIGSAIPGARGVAVSSHAGRIYVSGADKKIWAILPGGGQASEFASFQDEGEPAGLALDEQGNLYVARDGGGKVSVLDSQGAVIAAHSFPGPKVVSVAFGGLDLKTLYVAEATAGALYRLPLPHPSQRLPWDPRRALRITSPANGDILNRHDGEPTSQGLRITVEGEVAGSTEVLLNGKPAAVAEDRFRGQVVLDRLENAITAESAAGARDAITVLWDRNSAPRYRVSTDDNILFLKDIADQAATYGSIFDNPYLAFWREMHEKYGAKIHHNIYYETPGFNLSRMPDKFKPEWRRNASWMRLSFHARSNDPDRPYLHASAEKILEDYHRVTREIERFAGKETLGSFTTVHWGEATAAAAVALRRQGVRGLAGYFRTSGDFPSVSYYLSLPQTLHLMGRDYWKDIQNDILFVRHDMVINTIPLDEITPYLEKVAADPHQAEVMELMIHEQYFYSHYRSYQPDFRQRVERAIEFVHSRGYRPVFYGEGFLGARQ